MKQATHRTTRKREKDVCSIGSARGFDLKVYFTSNVSYFSSVGSCRDTTSFEGTVTQASNWFLKLKAPRHLFLFNQRFESCSQSADRDFAPTRPIREREFYNSAISKHVTRARIVVEMGSHPTKRFLFNHTTPSCSITQLLPVQSHNSFLDQRS